MHVKKETTNVKSPSEFSKTNNENGVIKLGEKLTNPFSVENMKKAYENLKSKNKVLGINTNADTDFEIETNAYYVRFLADTEPESDYLETIEDSLDVALYDVPLDYEIVQNGDYYHDPTIAEDMPTWQYTAVSTSFNLQSLRNNGIEYEVLDNLYLPGEYGTEQNEVQQKKPGMAISQSNQNFSRQLVEEAERIAEKNPEKNSLIPEVKADFNPQGKIQVYDTRLARLIPLKGVKVRARRWFTIREVLTNENGDYFINSGFSRPVNYAIFYERDEFDIRSGQFGQAWYNGPKQTGRWDVNINDGVQRFYAHVFRGAERYHYGNINGLKKPDLGWQRKLKYAARDIKGRFFAGINFTNSLSGGYLAQIEIVRFTADGREYYSDEIFSTTVHETSHSTFEKVVGGLVNYIGVSSFIRESWAVSVEWMVTQMEYREKGIANYGDSFYSPVNPPSYPNQYGYQFWNNNINDQNYTPVFIDLVDNFNQFGISLNPYNASNVSDNVIGYTLADIETNLLKDVVGVNSLREKLKLGLPTGITDSDIDILTSSY